MTAGIPQGGDVTLREALEVLGVERVRRGMRAIDDRRYDKDSTCSCFVGEAFDAESYEDYFAAVADGGLRAVTSEQVAACVVEAWYEGCPRFARGRGVQVDLPGEDLCRAALRAECVAFLAENGSAPEPVVHPLGEASVIY